MQQIRCYRLQRSSDSIIRLEPDPEAELLTLLCHEGVRVSRSGTGDTLLYRDGPYGVHPDQAIQLGWCRLCEPEETAMSDGTH